MSDKKFTDRTTEEIRAINDVDLSKNNNSGNKYKVPFIIFAVAFVVLLVFISIKYATSSFEPNYAKAPDKDEALRYAWESDSLKFEYDGKDLSVDRPEELFALLKSDSWKEISIDGNGEQNSVCSIKLDTDYSIIFYENFVSISKNNSERYYEIESSIIETLCGYLEANTYISIDDMTSLLSISESLTLEINGIFCITNKGQSIANALNTQAWAELEGFELKEDPFLTVTDPIGLKITIYETAKIAVVSYKGNVRYYQIDDLVPATVALAAKSAFDAEALLIEKSMNDCNNLIVVLDGDSFRIDSNSSWSAALNFSSWTRRYRDPAAIPESAEITIFDDISFILKIYKDLLVAEYNNAYYNIDETVISSIESYLVVDTPEDKPVEVKKLNISDFVTEIMKNTYVNSNLSGKSSLTSVSTDLIKALYMSSWKEIKPINSAVTYDVIISTEKESKDNGFKIQINTESGFAHVEWKDFSQFYDIDSDISSVVKYIQNNVYTELWQISATELGALQNAATYIETIITESESERKYLTSEIIGVSDITKIAASLNLSPIDEKPEFTGSKKVEMTFKSDSNKFLVTFFKDSADRFIVSVSGTLSDLGKRVDRNFVAADGDYNKLISELDLLIDRSYDFVAGTFVEAIKSMNHITLNSLTGNTYDYRSISNVKFNSITSEKTSERGKYIIKLNVADPEDGPFDAGESVYVLILGSTDGGMTLKAKSFIKESEYNESQKTHDAITVAFNFASWFVTDNPYFTSLDNVEAKKSAADYLMILALKNELNTVLDSDPTGMYFTPEVLDKMALKYFNSSSFDAKDTSVYNSETGYYTYTNAVVPMDLKRVVSFEEDQASNKYYVTISWYEDPMYLYETQTVVYTLDKSGEDIYRILSATESKPEADNTENNSTEEDTDMDDSEDTTVEDANLNDDVSGNENSSENVDNPSENEDESNETDNSGSENSSAEDDDEV